MSGIFISYRREDSAAHAGRLHDRLTQYFGPDQVFMDVDDIAPGADFARQIDMKVGSCDAVIVMIGRNWLSARNESGQLRLSDPGDFVGLEVALALQRNILVIPVLVGGASMPRAEELRADLRSLARRNAVTLSDRDFQRDADALIGALEKLPGLEKRQSADDERAQLRKRLLGRLKWKVPVILLLVSFALWWEWNKEQDSQSIDITESLAGTWTGEVTYSWGAKHIETFRFRPEGAQLLGTAGFVGRERRIAEGKIEGNTIAFVVRFEEVYGADVHQRENRYLGKLAAKRIHMSMHSEGGEPPTEWYLSKRESP